MNSSLPGIPRRPWRCSPSTVRPSRFSPAAPIILVDFKSSPHVPQTVIDISRAADLKGIEITDEGLRIGALATHTEIMRSPLIREMFPALADAAHTIGAVQTRNLGTLGGNLVTCVPSMDSGPTLIALEALVTIAGTCRTPADAAHRIFRRAAENHTQVR